MFKQTKKGNRDRQGTEQIEKITGEAKGCLIGSKLSKQKNVKMK